MLAVLYLWVSAAVSKVQTGRSSMAMGLGPEKGHAAQFEWQQAWQPERRPQRQPLTRCVTSKRTGIVGTAAGAATACSPSLTLLCT